MESANLTTELLSAEAGIGMQLDVPRKKRLPIAALVRLAISLILIACIIWWLGGLGKIAAIMGRISFGWAALVVLLLTFDRALMTFKWRLLLKARGAHIGFLRAMKIYCASMIWGMFLPTTVGPDTIRAVSVSRTGINANEAVASIVIERVFGFLSVLLFGLCSLLLLSLSGELESRFIVIWWAALIMIGLTLVALATSLNEKIFLLIHNRILGRFHSNRIAAKVKKFHETYLAYRKHTGTLVTFSMLTIVEQLVPVAMLWLSALALDIDLSLLAFLVAVPLSLLVSRLPIGVYGLGTFEAAFVFLLSESGLSGADAVAISFSGRILEILAYLPWWLAHVISTGSAEPESKKVYPKPATAEAGSNL
jgi:glycosyltransferase 2 family protein